MLGESDVDWFIYGRTRDQVSPNKTYPTSHVLLIEKYEEKNMTC